MSTTAIVTPAALRTFAGELKQCAQTMRNAGSGMRDKARTAGAVWKDAKYQVFLKTLSECVEDLEKFNKSSALYAEFLEEKARLADRYLKGR